MSKLPDAAAAAAAAAVPAAAKVASNVRWPFYLFFFKKKRILFLKKGTGTAWESLSYVRTCIKKMKDTITI